MLFRDNQKNRKRLLFRDKNAFLKYTKYMDLCKFDSKWHLINMKLMYIFNSGNM